MNLSLNNSSAKGDYHTLREDKNTKVIALAGNPNVGKSTVFNRLTGLKQHTGNWAGKTVSNAWGSASFRDKKYIFVDIPGTYSLFSHSKEEEIAGDFLCFSDLDAVVVVCDATCLERNLNLALQILEITENVILCVNLMDEAEKKKLHIDLKKLSEKINIPVVGASARQGKGLTKLMNELDKMLFKSKELNNKNTYKIKYPAVIKEPVEEISALITAEIPEIKLNPHWTAIKLLEDNTEIIEKIDAYCGFRLCDNERIKKALSKCRSSLLENNIDVFKLRDMTARAVVLSAEEICSDTVVCRNKDYSRLDRKIDALLTNRISGFFIMLLMLGFIFWLTICAANVPSAFLSAFFSRLEVKLIELAAAVKCPEPIYGMLIFGIYRVVTWVISVMLPPMAVFFPLFTLLEDLGFLPRIAFNLDNAFKKCHTCGKQALTMCMGLGCNAAGITGCRIIDSPRERLIAIITNSFVPCNGKFPMLISLITIFFTYSVKKPFGSLLGAFLLIFFILLGICTTFIISSLLSKTVLKGTPTSFTLELPPYRIPQIGRTVLRSVFDRTLFVLGRAVCTAAPAGLIIWLFSNTGFNGSSLLDISAGILDPFARPLGMDGKILLAFILGIPANEIVIPIIIMAYTSSGTITEAEGLLQIKALFEANGWTWVTAASTIIFSLMHWPCATSLLTVKKETGSLKWTFAAFIIPALCGALLCFLFNTAVNIFI